MRLNLARLNHILIPARSEERDRLRRSGFGRILRPLGALYEALTQEGQWVLGATVLSTVLALEVDRTEVYLVWAALAGLMAGALVVSRAFALRETRVAVTAPLRVTLGEEVVFTVTLHNDGPLDLHGVRVAGPFLPWDGAWLDGSWSGVAPTVPRVPAHGSAATACRARFTARGDHHLDPFHAALVAPLGLTQGPALPTPGVRFIVVPRLARVEHLGVALGPRHQPGGVARAVQTGTSMDLRGVRPYRAGDPVRDLHARSWARTGRPVVREYQQEYFRRVAVVLDLEGDEAGAERFEAAIALAAGIVDHAAREDALVDLLVVGSAVHELSTRGGSRASVLGATLDVLACVPEGSAFDAPLVERAVAPFLTRLSALVLVTLRPDEARTALAGRLERSGLACIVATVVGPHDPPPPASVRAVRSDRIARGEAVTL